MMKTFSLVEDLKIGQLIEVSGTSVKVELTGDVRELTRVYDGRVYHVGQIGSIVKVHFGRRLLFGFVTLLRMRSEEELELMQPIPPDADQRVMHVELFAEGLWNATNKELHFFRGVTTYPLPRQGVYLLTKQETELLYAAAEGKQRDEAVEAGGQEEDQYDALVPFANYVGAAGVQCHANVDKMLGMHCAILGSTGSGKSGAVAALLHSMLEHYPFPKKTGGGCHPRIVIIDPHGEYGHAFGERAQVYRAYDPIGTTEDAGERISLPYWLMSSDEFRMLVLGMKEREAKNQSDIVYKALTHARMVAAELVQSAPNIFLGKKPPAEDTEKLRQYKKEKGVDQLEIEQFNRDKPRPFSLDEFYNHIRFMQAGRIEKSQHESDIATRIGAHLSVLDKLAVIRNDPRLQFMMENWKPGSPDLACIISQLVGELKTDKGQHKDIRILDISGLPNEVAGPLTAAVARLLFQYKLYQTEEERARDPILLVCEEAHRYVPNQGEAEYAVAQTSVRRIAREGRKYGIGLMLVSQRPADVESTVISQCGTWLVLRLTNADDQQHVARFLPDNLSGMTRMLPALSQQEAIFVGEGAALPARIRVRDLRKEQLPKSRTAEFARSWAMARLSDEEIRVVAERMCK